MNGIIEILYCGGDKDYDGILFSALSAMRRTARPLRVHLFTAAPDHPDGKPVEDEKTNYLRALLERRDDGSTLSVCDMTEKLEALRALCCPQKARDDPYALLRLLCDEADSNGKLLCLDRGALLCGDVGKVYDLDLRGSPAGGVRDPFGSLFCRPDYIDAGVLLVDMPRARETGFFRKARGVLEEYRVSRPVSDALNNTGLPLCQLPPECNEQRWMKRGTLIRVFGAHLRFFPYLHRGVEAPDRGYSMTDREYRLFKRVYEEYLLQREGRKSL